MPKLTAADFTDVLTHELLQETLATGFGPSGEPGTTEHALNVADALGYANADVYFDYGGNDSGPDDYAETAAVHANISSLQVAADYAAEVMIVLANNPELMEQVKAAMDATKAPSPR